MIATELKQELELRGWVYVGRCGCGGWNQEKYRKGMDLLKVGIQKDVFYLTVKKQTKRGLKTNLIKTLDELGS